MSNLSQEKILLYYNYYKGKGKKFLEKELAVSNENVQEAEQRLLDEKARVLALEMHLVEWVEGIDVA